MSVEVYVEHKYECSKADRVSLDSVPWLQWFEIWLNNAGEDFPQAEIYELSLLFISDREMTELNNQYRQKNQPTDVLAFAALENELVLPPSELSQSLSLGDIVISLDTASRQAQERSHSLIEEVTWLATHGLLHLLGWDHPDDQSLHQMLQKQEYLRKLVRITE